MKNSKLFLAGAMIFGLWVIWTIFVVKQGFGIGPLTQKNNIPNFSSTGAFGDSYGGFSALISSLALLGVILSLKLSQDSEESRGFDSNFFTLLGHYQQIILSMDVHLNAKVNGVISENHAPVKYAQGRDATRFILGLFYQDMKPEYFRDSKIVYLKYNQFFQIWENDLGHYFRLLYHIFKLIDESCPGDKAYYSRIVRAHLSQSELTLLAYNCIAGEGVEKFVKYVDKYSLLHNISKPKDVMSVEELKFFKRKLGDNAFGKKTNIKFKY